MYRIITRYQYRPGIHSGLDPIAWTKWFPSGFNCEFETLKEAKAKLKELKETTKSYDKATKLKHEFDIEEYEYTGNN